MVLTPFPARAQIQQAWVARYNNGIANGTNQATKMALDSAAQRNLSQQALFAGALEQLGQVARS